MATYTLLEKITVGAAGASSVTFSGIPQTGYTDLKVVVSARCTAGGAFAGLVIAFNGSSANYTLKWLGIAGTGPVSYTESAFGYNHLYYIPASSATANTFGNGEVYIPNYTSSNYKSLSADGANEDNATSIYEGMSAGLWSQTAAINQLTFTTGGSFVQYSTFYLYGVAKLGTTPTIAPKATGGDTIMTDGTYWYHTFNSSGTFTPALALSCDVLTIAGGGGGQVGGGGAGGLLYSVSQNFATNQTIVIGGGGSLANGNNSSTGSLTATGGGTGSTNFGTAGQVGGSGGGGGDAGGGNGTAGQGNKGGNGSGASNNTGGGGGAGAAGSNAPSGGNGGAGGNGSNAYSAWATATGTGASGYYAGGGGGRGSVTNGANGLAGGSTANLGGGGLGTNSAGGSGLVIVRYAV